MTWSCSVPLASPGPLLGISSLKRIVLKYKYKYTHVPVHTHTELLHSVHWHSMQRVTDFLHFYFLIRLPLI